jgi:predicted dinucleotide-binding enzyme
MNKEVVVVVGPGQIGQAIGRRVGVGRHMLVADNRAENVKARPIRSAMPDTT